jgi:hypothetical protein
MSEKKEMDIEYNNIKTKLSLPDKFSEFKELCFQTFYISELRSQKIHFYYVDEDNDYVNLDEKSYENEDARKAEFWKLSIGEIKKDNSSNTKKNDQSIKEFIAQKEALLQEAKLYKEKLFGECNRIIEEKIKKKNEEHKNNIQKIKDEYTKNLKEFKDLVNKKTKEMLGKISENAMNVYIEKSQYIDKNVIENMSKKLGEFKESKKDFEVNISEIGNNINDTCQNVKECKEIFKDIVKESKSNFLKFIIYDANIKINSNELKNDIQFKIKIRKFEETDINNSFLRIQSSDKTYYKDIKIDLSDILKGEKEKEITFNPQIDKIKDYLFNMVLFNKNNIISNVARLTITVIEVGSSAYLLFGN